MKLSNKKYKYLLCDSVRAFNFFKNKVNYSILLSASPALLMNKNIKAESIYKFWVTDRLRKFQKSIFDHNREIYIALNKVKMISLEENIVTNLIVSNFQKTIFKIACISEIKKNDSCLIISHESKNKFYKYTNNDWVQFLKDHKKIDNLEYKEKQDNNKKNFNFFFKINFFQRIFFAGLDIVYFRLFKKINLVNNFFQDKKYLICVNENELLLETAAQYMNRGYKVLNFTDTNDTIKKDDPKKIEKIYKLCEPLIEKRLRLWTNKNYHKITLMLFKKILKKNLNNFYRWEKITKNFFYRYNYLNSRNTMLFCNAPANEKCLAIKKVFNENGIPMVAFQHGVSAEISNSHKYNRIFHDTTVSDIYVAFNKKSADISKNNPFSKAKTIKFRGSKRFNRVNFTFFNNAKKDSVLFLSNNLYKGNFGSLGTWTTDEDMANNEIYLIKNVLKKIKKSVFYKPYPEINHRYFDKDPALSFIKRNTNLHIIKNGLDARYIVSNYKIIVCGSATSTLSWALMINRPLVFINYKNHACLQAYAYKLLKKSVFLFNFDDKMFTKKF